MHIYKRARRTLGVLEQTKSRTRTELSMRIKSRVCTKLDAYTTYVYQAAYLTVPQSMQLEKRKWQLSHPDKAFTRQGLGYPGASRLCEIINAAFDERLELVARRKLGNVAVQTGTRALGVPHLAQHATVGAGNAFNSPNGSVRID